MLNLISKLWGSVLTLLVALVVSGAGCGFNDSTGPNEKSTQPELPPASTMVMDFSNFTSSGSAAKSTNDETNSPQILSRFNWGWAGANILVWNSILTITMVTPIAAFIESFRHEPVQQPDGAWKWSYNFHVLGIKHTAELFAKVRSSDVRWDMYISKSGGTNKLHWFFGESNLNGKNGTWTLNNANGTTPVLFIQWQHNAQNGIDKVKYTNVIPNDPENGGYIEYGVNNETPFNAFYEIFNKGKNNHTDIEWNRGTNEGRVKDPLHFNNSSWHCWDSNLDDAECSQ